MRRLVARSLAVAVALTAAVHLLEWAWQRTLAASPRAVDQVTVLSRAVRAIEAVYLPAAMGMFVLSPNVHQPSSVAAALTIFVQSFAMALLVLAATAGIRRLARGRRAVPGPGAGT